jgi:hypothetical protein
MTTAIVSAVIAVVVAFVTTLLAAPVRLLVEQRLVHHRLRTEQEFEQRRELRKLIGRFHGRLVEAAERLHYRMLNIYAHDPDRWLTSPDGFYLKTTAYRLLHLIGLARSFEREAYYVDARIAYPNDLDFVRFVKAFLWVLSEPALFSGLKYDESRSTDHFFADQLRLVGEAFCPRDGECLEMKSFFDMFKRRKEPFEDVKEFLVGLNRDEDRYRWDRLVALDFLLIGFLNTVGYGVQKTTTPEIEAIAHQLKHREVAANFVSWLPRFELNEQEGMISIHNALEALNRPG